MEQNSTRTFGTRPTGACAPDGTSRWAARSFEDGAWTFTSYDGWLIDSETTTTDQGIAEAITAHLERIHA